MHIYYLSIAAREYDEKLARIAQRPFTTHSIRDFIEDLAWLEAEILARPGQRLVRGALPGWYRVGPSRIYSYSLIYRLKDGNAYIVATAAPGRRDRKSVV